MTPRIFLSYARADGSEAAKELISLLNANGQSAWQDLRDLDPDGTVWPQIEAALRGAEFMIVLVTPAALKSNYIRSEWREARRNGATIMPVRATEPSRSTWPRWLNRGEVFDLSEPTHREKFLARLNSTGGTFRADWDAGLRIETAVKRPRLVKEIKERLLDDAVEPISQIFGFHGRGGYGKSVLAGDIARDPEIRDAYIDGVFWVSVGQQNPDVLGKLNYLIARISGGGGAPDVSTAAEELRRLIDKRDVLIILDDVWRSQDISPFVMATGHGAATLLATTRISGVLPRTAYAIDISAMEPAEALEVLSLGLAAKPGDLAALLEFAREFWYWPQLLAIANGILTSRLRDGQYLLDALRTVAHGAREGCVPGWDERERTVSAVIQMGIDQLPQDARARFALLAIVPEDTSIPVALLSPLWGLGLYEAEQFAGELLARSLIQSRDMTDSAIGAQIQLHDDMVWHLSKSTPPNTKQALQKSFLATHCPVHGDWAALDKSAPSLGYIWRNLLWHLENAGLGEKATLLCCDYSWIKSKLELFGIGALLEDYRQRPNDRIAAIVGDALTLSRQELEFHPEQLGWQIYGRIGRLGRIELSSLCYHAKEDIPLLEPIDVHFDAPGVLLMRRAENFDCVAFSPDGSRVVCAPYHGTLQLWDPHSGAWISESLSGHPSIRSLSFSHDSTRIMSMAFDGSIRFWDGANCAPLGEAKRVGEVRLVHAAFSPDDMRIVYATVDGKIGLWDVTSEEPPSEPFSRNEGEVSALAFSPDGKRIVCGGYDGTLRLWDVESGTAIGEPLGAHESPIRAIAFSPDCTQIFSGDDSGTLIRWAASGGTLLGRVQCAHACRISWIFLSPDGIHVNSIGEDGNLLLWDSATGAPLGELVFGHGGGVRSADLSRDGARMVSAGKDGTLRLWDVAGGTIRRPSSRGHTDRVDQIAFSPDLTRIATGCRNGSLRLWDAATGTPLSEPMRGHNKRVEGLKFTPDGTRIVSWGEDMTVRIWDAASGTRLSVHRCEHKGAIQSMTVSAEGWHIVSQDAKGILQLWNLDGRWLLEKAIRRRYEWNSCVAFAPDGAQFVCVGDDSPLELWDSGTGECLTEIVREGDAWVFSMSFSSDCALVVTGHSNGKLRMWDVAIGAPIDVDLTGHMEPVNGVAFSPNDKRIVSTSADGALVFWDADSGTIDHVFQFDASLTALAVSKTGVAIGDELGNLHLLRWRHEQ